MEINDALVTTITRELIKRLGPKIGVQGSPLGEVPKKCPLVISGEPSAAILESLERDYDIIRHSGSEAVFPDNAKVLIARLGIQALVRLSEGDAGCTCEGAALLWALLRGKKPIVVEEGIQWREYKNVMCSALAAKYVSHERNLASYGALFVREAELSKVLACAESGLGVSAGKQGKGQRKRVISEAELRRLCPTAAGTLTIGFKDILTPLAEDYIAKMRITVNRIN
jgi:ethanolamine utilization protein